MRGRKSAASINVKDAADSLTSMLFKPEPCFLRPFLSSFFILFLAKDRTQHAYIHCTATFTDFVVYYLLPLCPVQLYRYRNPFLLWRFLQYPRFKPNNVDLSMPRLHFGRWSELDRVFSPNASYEILEPCVQQRTYCKLPCWPGNVQVKMVLFILTKLTFIA